VTFKVSFAVCNPIFHLRDSSSGVTLECLSLVITPCTFRLYSISSTSSRYVVAICTADTSPSRNSFSLYTQEILPSSASVSPCALLSACRVISDLILHILASSFVKRLGLKTSSDGFHSLPVNSTMGKCILSHTVGTRVSKCTTVSVVSKGINMLSASMPNARVLLKGSSLT
jgi:hypothetical protein